MARSSPPRRHTEGDHIEAQRGDGPDTEPAGPQGSHPQPGHRARGQHAGAVLRIPESGHRKVDAGDPGVQYHNRLKGFSVIIDVFNHFMPKSIFERLSSLVPGHVTLTAFPELPTLWDVEARLRMMDEFEGLQQVLSLANPPIEMLGPSDKTPELARIANDGLAELCRRHQERFPAFVASMPMNNVEACVREADRAIGELGAKGIQIFTNVLGRPLSAPEFRPIFRSMVKHDLPVWIHPIRGPQFSDYPSEKAS